MRNCPNCGALISDGDKCSLCNAPLNNEVKQDVNLQQPNIVIDSLYNQEQPVKNIYEPLPVNNEQEVITQQQEINNINQSEEDKKNVMTNILKEHEEKIENTPKKDESVKGAILSLIVIAVIVAGGYFGVKFGFNKITNGEDKIINSVISQANNYTTIVKNYMKKYDYKYRMTSLNGYYAKGRTNFFLSIPLTSKCTFKEGVWSGADEDEVSCQKFFNDINNNYCTSVPCDIPSEAEIYLKETYETMTINEVEETVTTGTILDGTTLVYDDVTCSLSNNIYTCKFIEK